MCIPQTTGIVPEQVIEKQSQTPNSMTYQYYYRNMSIISTQSTKRQAGFSEAKCQLLGDVLVDKAETHTQSANLSAGLSEAISLVLLT